MSRANDAAFIAGVERIFGPDIWDPRLMPSLQPRRSRKHSPNRGAPKIPLHRAAAVVSPSTWTEDDESWARGRARRNAATYRIQNKT